MRDKIYARAKPNGGHISTCSNGGHINKMSKNERKTKQHTLHTIHNTLTLKTHGVNVCGHQVVGNDLGGADSVLLLAGPDPLRVVLLDLAQILEQLAHLCSVWSGVCWVGVTIAKRCGNMKQVCVSEKKMANIFPIHKTVQNSDNQIPHIIHTAHTKCAPCWRWGCWRGPGSRRSRPRPETPRSARASGGRAPV